MPNPDLDLKSDQLAQLAALSSNIKEANTAATPQPKAMPEEKKGGPAQEVAGAKEAKELANKKDDKKEKTSAAKEEKEINVIEAWGNILVADPTTKVLEGLAALANKGRSTSETRSFSQNPEPAGKKGDGDSKENETAEEAVEAIVGAGSGDAAANFDTAALEEFAGAGGPEAGPAMLVAGG